VQTVPGLNSVQVPLLGSFREGETVRRDALIMEQQREREREREAAYFISSCTSRAVNKIRYYEED